MFLKVNKVHFYSTTCIYMYMFVCPPAYVYGKAHRGFVHYYLMYNSNVFSHSIDISSPSVLRIGNPAPKAMHVHVHLSLISVHMNRPSVALQTESDSVAGLAR